MYQNFRYFKFEFLSLKLSGAWIYKFVYESVHCVCKTKMKTSINKFTLIFHKVVDEKYKYINILYI